MIANTIQAQYGGAPQKFSYVLKAIYKEGLTTYKCLQVINLLSFNSLKEREIRINTFPPLLKPVTMLAQKEIFL